MGLFDRNYMRGDVDYFRQRTDGKNMLWLLIGINIGVFILWQATMANQYAPGRFMMGNFILSGRGLEAGRYWQLVSSMFSHYDFTHLLLNMWGLYLFGSIIAPYLGGKKLLGLYLVSGLIGNLVFLLFNWDNSGVLGASGSVYGVTMACAMLEPNRRFVIIFMPFAPVKTSTMVICFTIIEVLSQLASAKYATGVAHLAHLGGFAGGYLFIKFFAKNCISWDILKRSKGPRPEKMRETPQWTRPDFQSDPPNSDSPVTQKELDQLLDKIARQGINSLSNAELARMRRAREQMRGS